MKTVQEALDWFASLPKKPIVFDFCRPWGNRLIDIEMNQTVAKKFKRICLICEGPLKRYAHFRKCLNCGTELIFSDDKLDA